MSPKRRNLSAVFLGSGSAFDATSPPLANRLAFESLTAVEFPGHYDERTNNTGKFTTWQIFTNVGSEEWE
jgi:hypothetical protein